MTNASDINENLSDTESYCKFLYSMIALVSLVQTRNSRAIANNKFEFISVLVPVNEYSNIADKIQTANNLLFADIQEDETGISHKGTSKVDKFKLHPKHRVTFSSDIEEYDDDDAFGNESGTANDDDVDREIDEIIERSENQTEATLQRDSEAAKVDGLLKNMSIDEIYSTDEDSLTDAIEYATELEVIDDIDEVAKADTFETPILDSIINGPSPDLSPNNDNQPIEPSKNCEPTVDSSKPVKNTFNSKVNALKKPTIFLRRTASSAQSRLQHIPNEKELATTTLSVPQHSYRKLLSANNIRLTRSDVNAERQLLNIHLNVKSCCEYKCLENNSLPRYNGYISQYGLSKDQLEHRDRNRQLCQERKRERQRELWRAKQELTKLNEQAFKQWLVRKDRLAKPKYKNWYDFNKEK